MPPKNFNTALLALLLISGLGLFAWWATQLQLLNNQNWTSLPPDIPALPVIDTNNQNISNFAQTLERPLFWESRRPLPLQVSSTTTTAAVPMELLGIVSEGDQRVALLRPLQGTPPLLVRRLRQGESYSGMTLQSIDNHQVTLETASGIQTLQLKRGSQNSNFKQQPAKLSAPDSIKITRENTPPAPQNRIDELKTKATPQAQPPTPPKP